MQSDFSNIKTTLKRIKVSSINVDPDVSSFALESIATLEFRVSVHHQSPEGLSSEISPDGVRFLLMMHPVVAYNKDGKYFCIAGLRTYFLAQMVLPSNESIPVTVLKSVPISSEMYAYADLYLGQLFLCLKNIRDIGNIFVLTPSESIKNLTPRLTSKVKFAAALECSRGTVFCKNRHGGTI